MVEFGADYAMEESVGRDRISELHNSLIHHIFSFLPLSDVVSTSLLSKRWNNLWTTVPCLNFCNEYEEHDDVAEEKIQKFINRALLFWKGAKILKFRVHLHHHFRMTLAVDVDLWLHFAVVNKVEDLNIHLKYKAFKSWDDPIAESKKDIYIYMAPQYLNSCSWIRSLTLVGCNLRIREPPSWTQLKRLKLDGFCFGERLINRILLGCCQLEVFELRLLESGENLNIRSTSLKILKIKKYLYFNNDGEPSGDTMLRICCANLEMLEITGELYCKCLFTNVSSLTDATIGFDHRRYYGTRWNKSLRETLKQIFSTIQHVEKVTLSRWCVEVLAALQKKYWPSPLSKVKFVKLKDVHITKLGDILDLSRIFPNLKMLVFEDLSAYSKGELNANNYLEFGTNSSKSFLPQLNTVVITSYYLFDSSIVRFMEFLLKHGSMLEKLVIEDKEYILNKPEGWSLLNAAQTLLSMPRSSPTAKVIFSMPRSSSTVPAFLSNEWKLLLGRYRCECGL